MPVGGGRLAFSSSNSHIPKTRCKNPEFGDCFFGKSFHIFPRFEATTGSDTCFRCLCHVQPWGDGSNSFVGCHFGSHYHLEIFLGHMWGLRPNRTWLNKSLGVGYTLPLSDFFLLDKREDFGQVIILLWCYPNGMLPLPVTVTTGLSIYFSIRDPGYMTIHP